MIIKGYIEITLDELETLYNKHSSLKKDIYYSKLSVLELCGWIEESLDSIIKSSIAGKIKSGAYRKIIQDAISTNYGFQYAHNFRPLLVKAVGVHKAEHIELKIDKNGMVQILSTTLGNLKKIRDDNAHSFIKGTTTIIQTPSVTQQQFRTLYPILKVFEDLLRN